MSTNVPSDIEIAQAAKKTHISEIAESIGLNEDDYDYHGRYIAKVNQEKVKELLAISA